MISTSRSISNSISNGTEADCSSGSSERVAAKPTIRINDDHIASIASHCIASRPSASIPLLRRQSNHTHNTITLIVYYYCCY
mmetsp:Transcript_23164/g.51559  ORF Transcript_23164/g.51559 Transcript_23164/m.51559 type:complete len:82 (+) Transcript_23164:184-429(+)